MTGHPGVMSSSPLSSKQTAATSGDSGEEMMGGINLTENDAIDDASSTKKLLAYCT
jgi:DMSO/TMAO reductase YedYZ molybdopterin-dependent catalytic subunit